MSRLDQRLKSLEVASGQNRNAGPRVIFIRFVTPEEGPDGPGRIGLARLCGDGGGQITRAEGESEDDFLTRAFAAGAPSGPAHSLRDEDLHHFLAGQDATVARALYEGRQIKRHGGGRKSPENERQETGMKTDTTQPDRDDGPKKRGISPEIADIVLRAVEKHRRKAAARTHDGPEELQ